MLGLRTGAGDRGRGRTFPFRGGQRPFELARSSAGPARAFDLRALRLPVLSGGGRAVRPSEGRRHGSALQCHDLVTALSYARRRQDRGHTSHLRRMQSPTGPADRTGTIGVEAFDAAYGAGNSPHALECELVENGEAFVAHRPTDADRPRIAFVDGTLRTVEARLTRTGSDGDVSMGLAGSWPAGAVLVAGDEPARFDQVTTASAMSASASRIRRWSC